MTDQPFPDTPGALLEAADQAVKDGAHEAATSEATRLAAYHQILRHAGLDSGEAFTLTGRYQALLHQLMIVAVANAQEQQ